MMMIRTMTKAEWRQGRRAAAAAILLRAVAVCQYSTYSLILAVSLTCDSTSQPYYDIYLCFIVCCTYCERNVTFPFALHVVWFVKRIFNSVVILEESPCPRGKSFSSRTNLQVFDLVLVLVLGQQSPWKLSRTQQSVKYHLKSINSVTATMHEVTVKNGLLTDVRYYLLMSVSN